MYEWPEISYCNVKRESIVYFNIGGYIGGLGEFQWEHFINTPVVVSEIFSNRAVIDYIKLCKGIYLIFCSGRRLALWGSISIAALMVNFISSFDGGWTAETHIEAHWWSITLFKWPCPLSAWRLSSIAEFTASEVTALAVLESYLQL